MSYDSGKEIRANEPAVRSSDLFGANGFIFLDDRPWPYLVTDKSGEWWLYYWSDGNKNFVTMRKLSTDEVKRFRAHALPPEKAAWYEKVAREHMPPMPLFPPNSQL